MSAKQPTDRTPDVAYEPATASSLRAADVSEIHRLLLKAEQRDGVAPLSEAFIRGLDDPRLGHQFVVAGSGQDRRILGIVSVDPASGSAEMVVDPDERRRGIATALYSAAAELLGTPAPGHSSARSLQVWAHGNLSGARGWARSQGLGKVRRLVVMDIDGAALAELATPSLPEDVTLSNAVEAAADLGRDELDRQWVEVNNEAFSWHPEQGGWTIERLRHAREAEWYSPEDVFFLRDDEGLLGFHWMKWHGGDDVPTGEVYVVGLAHRARGRGLGGPLLAAGLQHLREARGAARVILYVEDDNAAAMRAYEKLGFGVAEEHVVYATPGDS